MTTKRKRNRNYPVKTNHEDFAAMTQSEFGLTSDQIQAAAILRGAMRSAQAAFGPGGLPLEIVCARLPAPYVDKWARARLS